MADVGKMRIQPGLALSCLEVIVLFQREIENTVDLSQVEKNPTVVIVGSIV